VSTLSTARAIYIAIKDDTKIADDIKCEYKNLAKSIALDATFSNQITSASVNGQSFSQSVTMTNGERLRLLAHVVKMLTNERATSSRSTPIFY